MTHIETLPDEVGRRTALTQIERSFLVEAGAGSGKTSLMAGRVAVLLARGVEPKAIAAITFTEFAASELRIRIESYVNDLCKGTVPSDIKLAFPSGVSPEESQSLLKAQLALDELTCTTIHGFAQALIRPYPSEAGIDPGAEIVDPGEGDIAFDELYRTWLKHQLSEEDDNNVISELVLANQSRGLPLIRAVADFLRHNRDAKPLRHDWSNEACNKFVETVRAFEQEVSRFDFQEKKTLDACKAFAEIAKAIVDTEPSAEAVTSRTLVAMATIPRGPACFRRSDQKKRELRRKDAWEQAAADAGHSNSDGAMAFVACLGRYDMCHEAFNAVIEAVAGELLARTFEALNGLLENWRDYKRAAALLDFDDLLCTARDLLANNKDVRQALARRFRHVLVDEFQDTDPLQIDILWRICGETPGDGNPKALARQLRPGALFLVGDPNQAIYRFRGADVHSYIAAREAIGQNALVKIIANFRSLEPILTFVNKSFDRPLSFAAGQPGFTPLRATCGGSHALAVVALDVAVEEAEAAAGMLRDAEAERVAELCKQLVGNLEVRDGGSTRPCRFGDIALLAPVGTELWRFEQALEERSVPVSTQAGKGFFRRQEVQDLIALTCAIADSRDTLALGALLRGPLIGLTEEELLDIAEGLPVDPEKPDRLIHLKLWTGVGQIQHELARQVLENFQSLARRGSSTTPYILLADAVSLLDMRAQLRQRFRAGADRALANVDLFLEMARTYDVRGLRAFAQDMRANWKEQRRVVEGRPDAEEHAVSLITIHSAKGLEWPIVIPINMTGDTKAESGLMRRRSGEFSIPVLGIETSDYLAMKAWNEEENKRERVRLWYVACTRARDLLALPRHTATLSDKCWSRMVDLRIEDLPAIDPGDFGEAAIPSTVSSDNGQTRSQFAEQARKIVDATLTIKWHRPSLHEDAPPSESSPVFSDPESAEEELLPIEIKGSTKRGRILHKLMEEVLTGETQDTIVDLKHRACELLTQLGETPAADPKASISPEEVAHTVLRTLALPEVAALRPRLLPEITVFGGNRSGMEETLVSGVADALASDEDGKIDTIVDWKSDVEVLPDRVAHYLEQLRTYRKQTGAERALLVFMTSSKVIYA
jgi:exodeoxyribonuclease-5